MKRKIFLLFYLITLVACSNNNLTDSRENMEKLLKKESLKKYGKTLSLDEAIEISMERNLDLKIKNLEKEIAHLDKNIAFGNFLPSINIMGGYTKFEDNININVDTSSIATGVNKVIQEYKINKILNFFGKDSVEMPSSVSSRIIDKSFYTYGIAVQIPIFVPSTWYLYAARKKGEKISELVENLAKKMIELQTMGEYYYILALESEKKVLIDEFNSAKELEKKAKISLKVEAILPWQYQKAIAFRKSKEYALNENSKDLYIAKMNFLKDLNLNPLQDIKLEDIDESKEVNIPSMEDCIYEALSSNEILKISKISGDLDKDIKKISITNFLPKIILGGGYVNNSNKILTDSSFLNGNVSAIISIFNGFKNINEYKKAVRREKIGQLKLEKEFMKVIIETVKAYKNYENVKELKEIANLNYKAAIGELKQKKVEKRVQLISEEEYFNALSKYDLAFSMKKKAEFSYEMALGSLKIAMGQKPFKEGK